VAKTKPFDFDWQKIFELFQEPSVTKKYDLKFKAIDEKKIIKILCDEHDFSEERIKSGLEKLSEQKEKAKQKTLF
jgi:flap endonuclease-1